MTRTHWNQSIYISNLDNIIDMYQLTNYSLTTNVNMTTNSYWEWRVVNLNQDKVTLTIIRDPKSYEELYMKLYTSTGTIDYYTKDLSNCKSNKVNIELKNAVQFLIKSKMVNENSYYAINIHQNVVKESSMQISDVIYWAFIVVILLSVLCFICICII